jgi:hypothetical protein
MSELRGDEPYLKPTMARKAVLMKCMLIVYVDDEVTVGWTFQWEMPGSYMHSQFLFMLSSSFTISEINNNTTTKRPILC